ncbi:GNAT family N-acetyltransferase [Planococcus sp. FY231025]|uniref:GNAT family N-acetyltransferase n=1 Tax=Planococcus sp. FY231025 TaxID=3455699 RepID=UPI003F935CD7
MRDLFFNQPGGRSYETVGDGACEVFEFQHSKGTVKHTFLKREIAVKVDGETYYDLVTPLMYGGPVISDCSEGDKWELVDEFQWAFQSYCEENNIICEFVRFHPVRSNVLDFVGYYDIDYAGEGFATDLASFKSPEHVEFSEPFKSMIRSGLCAGVEYSVSTEPAQFEKFKRFYLALSKHADSIRPTDLDGPYFNKCMESLGGNLVVVEATYKHITIGMSLSFIDENEICCHLSLTLPEFETLSPAHVMQYGLTLWGKTHGFERIHLGGATPKEGLYLYKKQFALNTSFRQCVGSKVWNPEVYRRVCDGVGVAYLPGYRVKAGGYHQGGEPLPS